MRIVSGLAIIHRRPQPTSSKLTEAVWTPHPRYSRILQLQRLPVPVHTQSDRSAAAYFVARRSWIVRETSKTCETCATWPVLALARLAFLAPLALSAYLDHLAFPARRASPAQI